MKYHLLSVIFLVTRLEHVAEIGRACSQTAVHYHIAFHVQGLEMEPEIIPGRFNGNRICRYRYVVKPFCCSTVNKDKNRPYDFSAPKLRV